MWGDSEVSKIRNFVAQHQLMVTHDRLEAEGSNRPHRSRPRITDPSARGYFAVRRIDGWYQAHWFGRSEQRARDAILKWDRMSNFKWPAAIVRVTKHFYFVIQERGACIPQDFEHELTIIALSEPTQDFQVRQRPTGPW